MAIPDFWDITPGQQDLLRAVVWREHVADLGAGSGNLARLCARLGARSVLAVDKEYSHGRIPKPANKKIQFVGTYFTHLLPLSPSTIAIVSWPANYEVVTRELLRVTQDVRTVVYIGVNDGTTQCGTPALFAGLQERLGRPLKEDGHQDMLVYSRNTIRRPAEACDG